MKNKKLTHKEIIDKQLQQAGWHVAEPTQVVEEFDIIVDKSLAQDCPAPYAGRQYSDYVLIGKNGKPLAIVEAQKASVDANIGKEKAKQYCYYIQAERGGQLPFYFYTKEQDIYFWNLENYPHKKARGLPTRDDLQRSPITLQTQFEQIVEKTEVLKGQYKQSLAELEQLFGSLSQRAFKGEFVLPSNKYPAKELRNSA